jgi:CubicO group peptidase (beta-lactamase class C family)
MFRPNRTNVAPLQSGGTVSRFLFAAVFLFAAFAQGNAQPAAEATEPASITAQVDKVFEKWDRPDSPGCALAVIQDGRIVYKSGYGMANLDYDVPVTPSTVFNIASVSKQFTAAAIVLLAQRGKLSLDDEVRKYIPKLPDFGTPITIRQLIHHTSGLREQVVLLGLAGWRIRLDHITEEDVLGLLFRQRELNFRPGEKYGYSNTNYTLLALIVERASDKSFREFTRAHIFDPLGMKNSFFRGDRTEIVKNQAYGYLPTKGDTFRLSMPNDDTVGHTGLLTTVEDLARWDRNFYDGRVGGSALIEQLHQPGKLNDGTVLVDDAFGLIIATYRGLPIVEHGGGAAGYRAHLIRFPEQRFSVACLCNTTTHPSELARRVADIYLAKELKDPASVLTDEKTVELSEEQLASKTGLYWNRENEWIRKIVLKEGKLRKLLTYGRYEMKPLSENRFRLVGRPRAEVRFEAATPGARPRLAENFGGVEFRFFEPVAQFTPTRTELAAYVGTYVSEEAEATYRVALQDDKLVLKRPRREAASLQPLLRDVFSMPGYTIRFTRDSNNRVFAMLFNSYAIRNFRFTKQTP